MLYMRNIDSWKSVRAYTDNYLHMLTNIIAIQYMRNSRPSGEVESCSDRSHRAAPGGMAQAEPLEAFICRIKNKKERKNKSAHFSSNLWHIASQIATTAHRGTAKCSAKCLTALTAKYFKTVELHA